MDHTNPHLCPHKGSSIALNAYERVVVGHGVERKACVEDATLRARVVTLLKAGAPKKDIPSIGLLGASVARARVPRCKANACVRVCSDEIRWHRRLPDWARPALERCWRLVICV